MTKCSFTGSRWTNYKLKRYKEQVIRYIASHSIFLLTWPNGIEQVSQSRPGESVQFRHHTSPHIHINMDSKEYSIIADTSDSNDSVLIYNMKLTEELVEKLMKGQKDLDNLTGIEFSFSTSGDGKGIEVRFIALMRKWQRTLCIVETENRIGCFSIYESKRNPTGPFTLFFPIESCLKFPEITWECHTQIESKVGIRSE